MPLLQLHTSVPVPTNARDALLGKLSRIVAQTIGKPEQYVMVTLDERAMLMAGKAGPAAVAEVRSIGGLTPTVNGQLTEQLCSLLSETLAIPTARIFVTFAEHAPTHWGHDGSTFG